MIQIRLKPTNVTEIHYLLASFDDGISWQWVGDMWPLRFVAQHGYHGLLPEDQQALLEAIERDFPGLDEPVIVKPLTPDQVEYIREQNER